MDGYLINSGLLHYVSTSLLEFDKKIKKKNNQFES